VIFLDIFWKNIQIRNHMKIRPGGAELFNAASQTDSHDGANIRFSQFCEKRRRIGQLDN
jgi:hypothetical protein